MSEETTKYSSTPIRRAMSLKVEDQIDDSDSFFARLRMGEDDRSFGTDDKDQRLKPERVNSKVPMNWLGFAVNDIAKGAGLGPPPVTRVGTEHGCNLMRGLAVWPGLEEVFLSLLDSARQKLTEMP